MRYPPLRQDELLTGPFPGKPTRDKQKQKLHFHQYQRLQANDTTAEKLILFILVTTGRALDFFLFLFYPKLFYTATQRNAAYTACVRVRTYCTCPYLYYPFGPGVRLFLLEIGDDFSEDFLARGNVVVGLPRQSVPGSLLI